MPSSGSDLDQSATLRTVNSSLQLDLYKAPYEKRMSSTNLSVVDSVSKEFNALAVSDVRQRRDTFPVRPPLFAVEIELHLYFGSLSINLLGPRQLRNFNPNPSMDTDIMNKIKELYSLPFKAISLLTKTPSRLSSHLLFNNNQEDHDTVSQIPRIHQVSQHLLALLSWTNGSKILHSMAGQDPHLRQGVTA